MILLVVLVNVALTYSTATRVGAFAGKRVQIPLFTAQPGGWFVWFGEELQKLIARDDRSRIELIELPSGGSVDNLDRIAKFENAISFTFVTVPDYLRHREQHKAVRAIAILNRAVLHIVASEVSGIDEVTDLKEKQGKRPKYRVYVGRSGSGTLEAARELLDAADVKWFEEWEEPSRKINFEEAAEQLRRGELDAAIFATGVGAPAVERLLKEDRPQCRLIPLSEPVRDALVWRGFEKITMPAYDRKAIVETMGARVLIATHKNTQSWIVQELVKAIERNRKEIEPFLARIALPANETSALITETEMLQEILQDVPLHDGMIRRSWTWARSVWVHPNVA